MLKVVRAQGQGIVSDQGRWGYQHLGVPVGGVLDVVSFGLGNLALGNSPNASCLELMGSLILFAPNLVEYCLQTGVLRPC
jgi:allophanate hydrolase subunit 2